MIAAGVAVDEPAHVDVFKGGDAVVGGAGFEGVEPLGGFAGGADGDDGATGGALEGDVHFGGGGGAEEEVGEARLLDLAAALALEGMDEGGGEVEPETGEVEADGAGGGINTHAVIHAY